MITMKLQGGLGNQMFQYAAGYAIAKKLGVELALDISSYNYDVLRSFNLDLFSIENKIVFDSKPNFFEHGLQYDPLLVDSVRDGAVMVGYFQCEKYFKECKEDLKRIFRPKGPIPKGYQYYFDQIQKPNSVAVSVRRGDYLQLQAYHGVLPAEYYREALLHLVNSTSPEASIFKLNLIVFSDDIRWCKENFLYKNDYWDLTFVDSWMTTATARGREDADIMMMRQCRAHIIANSTFGWWGAYLSDSNRVIAPKNWFANGMKHDIIPEGWTQV